jgi:hypothetical protein
MSLLNTASPWNTDGGTRKRIPSIGKRKTQKTTVVDSDVEEEDDRASVVEEKHVEVVDTVEVPTVPVPDVDDLQTKTSSELRDILSKKGIPYGKRDSKTVLLQLLKASA